MEFSLIPLSIFFIGLMLFALPIGPKVNRAGEILMLAGSIGFCLSRGHALSIR